MHGAGVEGGLRRGGGARCERQAQGEGRELEARLEVQHRAHSRLPARAGGRLLVVVVVAVVVVPVVVCVCVLVAAASITTTTTTSRRRRWW